MNNDKKVKELLEKSVVLTKLEPENIRKMLEDNAPAKKRGGIKLTSRIIAAAAACAVVCASAVCFAGQKNVLNIKNTSIYNMFDITKNDLLNDYKSSVPDKGAYMNGADDYSHIYKLFGESYEQYQKNHQYVEDEGLYDGDFKNFMPMPDSPADENITIFDTDNMNNNGKDHHDTYNQEKGVIEADKAKTDGKYIYYADHDSCRILIAEAEDGKFGETFTLNIKDVLSKNDDKNNDRQTRIRDMYIFNGMITVIAEKYSYPEHRYNESSFMCDCILYEKSETNVLFYTTGENPEFIDSYIQDGAYSSARITPDGYMYLITKYFSDDYKSVDSADDLSKYVPKCGMSRNVDYIPADSLLLPKDKIESTAGCLNFTVAGSVDLNKSGEPKSLDSKAMAGNSGKVYCSADNLYCADGWENTEITRISLRKGKISPAASGCIGGYINDQFSMSEYGGYFRVAATIEKYDNTGENLTNSVYVLDMDMKIVGEVGGFGTGEHIKSVNFSGSMAYVVTFRQTDPLFSIDLSDPKNPKILDEFKINGFSSYMQPWTDGLLLGFGNDADDSGRITGVKLVMFDNSNPNSLKEVGKYTICNRENSFYSNAVDDRKQLLISPEKNLICVPVCNYLNDSFTSSYMLFSYENGEFKLKNTICETLDSSEIFSCNVFDRAVYIGDYVYILSGKRFASADIDTAKEKDKAVF